MILRSFAAFLSCGVSGSRVPLVALNLHLNAPPGAIPLELYRGQVEALRDLLKLLKGLKRLSLREIVTSGKLINVLTVPANSGGIGSDVLCPLFFELRLI